MTRALPYLVTTWLLALLLVAPAWGEQIAHVDSLEGVVVAEQPGQPGRVLAKGSPLEKGETVVTQSGSHALLIFNDQTQVAVRPNSRLQLTDFVFQEKAPQEDSFILRLLKGGLRQVTGLISRNKQAYHLQSQGATIGIRGTDFTARLCDGLDCTLDQSAAREDRSMTSAASGTVGKVVMIRGTVTAKSPDGNLRTLTMASPIFQGDVIASDPDGNAAFVMLDNTRLVLPGDSRVHITNYRFVASRSEEGSEIIDLLKGGLRVVTGLLGKLHNDRIQFHAASATIGIRGTAFDLVCAGGAGMGECGSGAFYVSMRSGEISLAKDKTLILVQAGQFAEIPLGALPRILPQAPPVQLSPQLPRPEDIKVDPVKLFGLSSENVETGLYVSVNTGEVVLANAGGQIILSRGTAGFAGAAIVPVQLPAVPGFMDRDPVLSRYHMAASMTCN